MESDSLLRAASCCDVDLVKRLIGAGENVNAIDPDGATALHLAISSGKSSDIVSQIVGLLIKAGASLNVRNNEGYSPLHVAAANGQVEFVDMLIRAGADVNAEINPGGDTSLFLAIKHDQPDNNCSEVIRLLIEAGASLVLQDANRFSPLRKAVVLGKVNAVRQLILSGAKVNELNNAGKSILLHASMSLKNDERMCNIIQMLLKAGALPNIPDSQGFTPLHAAATLGKARRVDQLIQAGADVNAIDKSLNRTILHSVILSVHSDEDRFEVVRLLLKAGVLLDAQNIESYDCLLFAAHSERVKTVEQLILAGANANSIHPKSGESCLHLVAKGRGKDDCRLGVIQLLLKAGTGINLQDRNRRTPLHNAAKTGNIQLIKQFIEVGADVRAKDSVGKTILSTAILCKELNENHPEVVRVLLNAGASIKDSSFNGKPLLHHAVSRGLLEIVEQLITSGADIHAVDEDDNTCLHTVVLSAEKYRTNRSQIVSMLLNAGFPLDGRNKQRQTPLHIAVFQGCVEWVEILTKAGASIKDSSFNGKPLLHHAISRGLLEIVEQLITSGADIRAVDEDDNTCLHTVVLSAEKYRTNRSQIVIMLLNAGFPLDGRNKEGETPLHIAVFQGCVEWVEILTKAGANVDAKNRSGKSSLYLALQLEKTDERSKIIRLLAEAGASITELMYGSSSHSPIFNRNLSTFELKVLAQGYANKYPDSEVSRGLISIGIFEDSTSYRLKVIRLLLKAADAEDQFTPLHYAVESGDVALAELIIKEGDDVNATTTSQETSLHLALRHNLEITIRHQIVQILLEANATVNVVDGSGHTPLTRALDLNDEEMVQQLITAGADPRVVTSGGSSCLHKAILKSTGHGNSRLVSLLISAGAPVNITDEVNHRTPLHYAVLSYCVETVKKLIRAGADVDVADRKGITCLLAVFETTRFLTFARYALHETDHPAQEIISYYWRQAQIPMHAMKMD